MPAPPVPTLTGGKTDQGSLRAHRKHIWSLIRNDFTFIPQHSTSTTAAVPPYPDDTDGSKFSSQQKTFVDVERVSEWREYTYGSSDPSSEASEEYENHMFTAALRLQEDSYRRVVPQRGSGSSLGGKIRQKRKSLLSHILPSEAGTSLNPPEGSPSFEPQNPARPSDEVLDDGECADDETEEVNDEEKAASARVKLERKRRRRQRFEKERLWNEGLSFWANRRDAWCCSRNVENPESKLLDGANDSRNDTLLEDCDASSAPKEEQSAPGVGGASPRRDPIPSTHHLTSTSSLDEDHEPPNLSPPPDRPETPASHPSSGPHCSSPTSTALTSPDHSDANLPASARGSEPHVAEIPVMTPILPPADPTRRQCHSPRAYGAIYSKIVIQGLTPSVPINLQSMTNALVQGWKQDGEWLPTSPATPDNGVRWSAASLRPQKVGMGRSVKKGKAILKEKAHLAS